MNLSLKVLSYENFSFSHERPIDYPYPRLPGGEVLFAQAPFGTICIQEFSTPHCVLRYGVIQPKETITIEIANFVSGLHCFVLQRGTISFQFPGPVSLKLRQGHHAILQASELNFTMTLEAGKQYIGFEIFFPFAAAAHLLEEQPLFLQRLQPDGLRLPDFWLRSPVPTPHPIGQRITEMLFFNDADSERGYYYGEEAKEIFSLLLEHPDEMQVPVLTAEQVEKVQLVQSRILEDLGEKHTTRQFSKLVGWSESILKRNFKSYTGQAIHQFRKAKRLDLALTLLHEGKLVKEVADQLGLSAGWLIKLYKAKYGTTPATMRKK